MLFFWLLAQEAENALEYTDDSDAIPRSHSVIVRRMPAKIPGKGSAQRYISGIGVGIADQTAMQSSGDLNSANRIVNGRYVGPMSLNNVSGSGNLLPTDGSSAAATAGENETEEERIKRILEQGQGDFDKRANEMAMYYQNITLYSPFLEKKTQYTPFFPRHPFLKQHCYSNLVSPTDMRRDTIISQ